jgi:hypothetical protein
MLRQDNNPDKPLDQTTTHGIIKSGWIIVEPPLQKEDGDKK